MPSQQLRFEQWANFYVITGAAAATLLGLLFVVITLAAATARRRGTNRCWYTGNFQVRPGTD